MSLERSIKLEAALSKPSPEAIHKVCSKLCRRFGFTRFLYLLKLDEHPIPRIMLIHGGSEQDGVVKTSNGMLRFNETRPEIPDFLRYALGRMSVDIDREIHDLILSQSPINSVQSCVSFPVSTRGHKHSLLILFSSAEWASDLSRSDISDVQSMVRRIHDAASQLISNRKPEGRPQLSPREVECLKWVAAGKTNWEIAAILGVSRRTVVFHLQNVSRKLDTSNRQHSVSKAISAGLIDPG